MIDLDTVKFDKKNAKAVAHRGVSGIEPENTCASFIAAGNRSYFGIETDVHVTADGRFIVIHDDTTGRTAFDDLSVENSSFDTLRSLKLLGKSGKKDRTDLRLPELTEYISICKTYGKVAVLELKNRMTKQQVLEIARVIKEMDYLDKVIFISFALDNLLDIRSEYPDQAAQYLTDDITPEIIETLKKHRLDLDVCYTAITKEYVDEIHSFGAIINCWTCDDKEYAEKLASWGVDQITSNILE